MTTGGDGGDEADSESGPKKRRTGATDSASDPSATLEANVENLNVKKFDLTFAVDPLFHKTSAQFDEGGAKGLPAAWSLAHLLTCLHMYVLHDLIETSAP